MTKKIPKIVLASTSRWRRGLLERLSIPFEVRDPECDESGHRHLDPEQMTQELAILKARMGARPGETALVIGSDQAVEIDGKTLGKPGSVERAVEQLMLLQGRTHRLITAVAVYDTHSDEHFVDVDIHRLTMHQWPESVIRDYVHHDEPIQCAGAYRLESRGLALFKHIEADPVTADDSAIVGLPLMKTLELLRRCGVEILTDFSDSSSK